MFGSGNLRRHLGAMVVIAVELLVPFLGGLIGLVMGLINLIAARRDVSDARAQMTDMPATPIADASEGTVTRVCGRITSAPIGTAFLTGREVVFSAMMGFRSRRGGTVELPIRRQGMELELRDDTGVAVLDLETAVVLSRHVDDLGPADSFNKRMKPILERHYSRFVEADGRFSMREITLFQGEEVDAVGRVASVKELERPEKVSYRDQGIERQITIASPDGETPLRVTNYTPSGLEELLRESRSTRTMAKVWLVLGAVNIAVSLYLASWWVG